MRIFFIGTVEFSSRALIRILDLGGEVVGVATKQASPFNADHVDLGPLCAERGIVFRHMEDINAPDSVDWIKGCRPDILFCFGWSSLLKEEILSIPSRGCIGYHPAALPVNRGRHPIIWALVLGLEKSASTFFYMDRGADSGDILSQEPFAIVYEDDAASLYRKITDAALRQIGDFLPRLQAGTAARLPQDRKAGNTWRKRMAEDGRIDFRMGSRAVYNLVRALARPYSGAHVAWKGRDMKVWKAAEAACADANLEPGKVLRLLGRTIRVKTYDGAVDLIEHGWDELPPEGSYL